MLPWMQRSAAVFFCFTWAGATMLAFGLADRAVAVGLNYVDGIAENQFFPGENPAENLGPGSAINTAGGTTEDNVWGLRENFGAGGLPIADPTLSYGVYESGAGDNETTPQEGEDSPQLTMTVRG